MKVAVLAVLVVAMTMTMTTGVGAMFAPDAEAQMAELTASYSALMCEKCQLKQADLAIEFKTFESKTVAECVATESLRCQFGLNATEDAACPAAVTQMCQDAAGAIEPEDTCSSLGVCNSGGLPPPAGLGEIWGECGACQDIVSKGIDVTEKFVCNGLSSALSAVCYAGAPVCEAVLDDACNAVIHYVCSTSCMATYVCHGFHACSKGPSESCCR